MVNYHAVANYINTILATILMIFLKLSKHPVVVTLIK